MEMNGGFLVTKIKQLGDRIFVKILSEKNIDAFNGAQGRIPFTCDGLTTVPDSDYALFTEKELEKSLRRKRYFS